MQVLLALYVHTHTCPAEERDSKVFAIHQVFKSSRSNSNHIEVDSLDKIDQMKKHTEIFYMFSKCSPCEDCLDMFSQWCQSNRPNMIIWGFDKDRENACSFRRLPNNLLMFDLSMKQMLSKQERRQTLNETFTKENNGS